MLSHLLGALLTALLPAMMFAWLLAGNVLANPGAADGDEPAATKVLRADGVLAGADGPQRACLECHGQAGRSEDPGVPSIGGFSEFAILDLLETYRRDLRSARTMRREDGSETDMVTISKSLSDVDLETVATYFAKQPWRPHPQTYDAALAERGGQIHELRCTKCHSAGASEPDDDLAIMAGQWRQYLAAEFDDFDDGTRRMPEKMKEKYQLLDAGDKAALLEYYVSGGGSKSKRDVAVSPSD